MTDRILRLGVAGLGKAFMLMLPGLVRHPNIRLVAGADPRPEARARFASDFGASVYETVDALCADSGVDAVYVATPHQFHAEHVRIAAAHGKHVLVEKPMALTSADCRAMADDVRAAGVHMVIGHSHSFDAPIAQAAALIQSGRFGPLQMITAINFTDFLYRPRRPEELDTSLGGGVIYNQAPHHVDMVRLLAGGGAKSVRALTGAWDPARPTEGAYAALLTFDNGAFATLTYSGYAHFDSDEFMGWVAESGLPKDPNRYAAARVALSGAGSVAAEATLKEAGNYGGGQAPDVVTGPRLHQQFGVLIASCANADLRPMPGGVFIYGDAARSFDALPNVEMPRKEVLDELCHAVFYNTPPLHNGEWGLATMEVCFAILRSAREGRDIAPGPEAGAP